MLGDRRVVDSVEETPREGRALQAVQSMKTRRVMHLETCRVDQTAWQAQQRPASGRAALRPANTTSKAAVVKLRVKLQRALSSSPMHFVGRCTPKGAA